MQVLVTNEKALDRMKDQRFQWIKALESGDFLQGRGRLVRKGTLTASGKDEFCCLGVACELDQPNTARWNEIFITDGYSSGLTLPEPLRKRLGISKEQQNILVTLNDGGVSFANIARVIYTFEFWEDK
jgi:hypothetical protein